jgi:hypothetical protein
LWEFQVDEGLVLARPDIHGLFLLNSSARLIWSEFRRGISQADIVAEFAAHFCVSSDVALRDIEATMASWHQGLLAPPPSPAVFPSSIIGGTEVCPIDCVVNGTPMRVLLESGDVWDEIAPRLEPVRADNLCPRLTFTVGSAAGRVLVFRDDLCIGNEENTAAARIILLQAMAAPCERLAILHAGCCGGILLAGESQSGKSTLCAALMRRGLSYHCDDSAVLDHEFRVAPMPFPIMLRSGSWPLLQTRFPELKDAPVYNRWGIDVRFLPLVPASDPTLVTALVFVRHEATVETQLAEISVLDSLLALQRTGFWVDHTPESIERFLGWLARIPRYNLHYAELEQAERVIGALADGPKAAL